MGSVTVTLMGPPQLQHAGDVQPWPSRKVLLLLSYLLLEPGRHTRDELAGLFWPESAPGVARSALRTVLTQLRRLLPDRLRVEGSLVDLHLLPGDTVDVLSDDVALSDQPFLLGIDVLEEGTLQEWLAAIRAYLQFQHRSRLQRQAQQLERTGQLGAARDLTERWFALDRTDEQATRALITVCQRLGDAGQVQDVYERHRHALAYDVGAQPSSEIQALVQESVGSGADGGVVPDFTFPALPVRSTSFVGRQEDLAHVQALVAGGARLVTLHGLGGIGKTRLALALGAALQPTYPGRVAFVPLETLQAVQDIPTAVLSALGLTGDAGTPALDRVIQVIHSQPTVLILDNAEHLLDGAALVETLLNQCPALTVIITSRDVLGLEQEYRYSVAGLAQGRLNREALDDAPPSGPSDAAQLFVQRAQQVRTDIQATPAALVQIEQLCRLVGGAPLAIELAASWVRVLPIPDLLRDLSLDLDLAASSAGHLPARQQSLRAVFEYSWARLTAQQQQALAALSVFRGGFTREAAQDVAAASLHTLARLVDLSLLQMNRSGRFDRHPLISQYIREKLDASRNTGHVMDRHARYFAELATRAFPQLASNGPTATAEQWSERLDADHQNLTLCLERLHQTGRAEELLDMCANLGLHWGRRGHERSGRQWFRRAILNAGVATGSLAYVRAQCLQGVLFFSFQFMTAEEGQWLRDGIAGCRQWGERRTLVFGLRALVGQACVPATQVPMTVEEARTLIAEALQIGEALGDPYAPLTAAGALGHLLLFWGERSEAEWHLERALALAQNLGDPGAARRPQSSLAMLAHLRGDFARSIQMQEASLSVIQHLGLVSQLARTHLELGWSYYGLGDLGAARAHMRRSLTHYRQYDQSEGTTLTLMHLAMIEASAGKPDEAETLLLKAERALGAEWPWQEWTLTIQASILECRQQPVAARTLRLTVLGLPFLQRNIEFIRMALEPYLCDPHPAADIRELASLLGAAEVFDTVENTVPHQTRVAYETGPQRIAERARKELGDAVFEELIGAARMLSLAEAGELIRHHAQRHLEPGPPRA